MSRSIPPSDETQSAAAVASIRSLLKKGDDAAAARGLADAINQGSLVLPREDAAGWITRHVGPSSAERLVKAFANYPCFYCRNGANVCGDCGGRGRVADGSTCDQCVSLGVDFCDFCNGSGWITLTFIPRGLRAAAIRRRARRAPLIAVSVIKAAGNAPNGQSPEALRKTAVRRLLQINHALGSLESVVEMPKRLG